MAILNVKLDTVGMSGVNPRVIYIDTNDTIATVATAGYLNGLAQKFGLYLSEKDMALVSTKETPNAFSSDVRWFDVSKSGNDWSLVPLEPAYVIKYASQATTSGGGAAEAITVTGALPTDLAFVQMVDDGTNNVTIVNAVVTADTLTVTFSADPGNDTIINYQIIRATR